MLTIGEKSIKVITGAVETLLRGHIKAINSAFEQDAEKGEPDEKL